MVDILGAVPLSVAGVIATLLNSIVAFIALLIVSKLIAHTFDARRGFVMAVVALFLTPVISAAVLGYVALDGLVSAYVLPILVWAGLSEVLLSSDMKSKLVIGAVGYVLYVVLSIFLAPYLFSLIPF